MAKAAKAGVVTDFSASFVKTTVNGILAQHDEIATARGSFMNKAKRHRERIASIIADAEIKGIPPKVTKLHIKITTLQASLKEAIAELEQEEQVILREMSKKLDKPEQLALFGDLGKGSLAKALKTVNAETETKDEEVKVPASATTSGAATEAGAKLN